MQAYYSAFSLVLFQLLPIDLTCLFTYQIVEFSVNLLNFVYLNTLTYEFRVLCNKLYDFKGLSKCNALYRGIDFQNFYR